MIRAVLFDFDGTLADTMHTNFECWKEAIAKQGRVISSDEFFPLEGRKSQEIARQLLKDALKDERQPEEVLKLKDSLFLERYKFSLYPGVEELLALIDKNDLRRAIVTAARTERLTGCCPKEFLNSFDFVVTNETSGRGKPFPDPYLNAAKSIGVAPSECLVIENAPLGVSAAKAAGMQCYAITSTLSKEHLKDADRIVATFSELLSLPPFSAFV